MNMIGNPTHPKTLAIQLAYGARKISMKITGHIITDDGVRFFVLKTTCTRLKLNVWGIATILCWAVSPPRVATRT